MDELLSVAVPCCVVLHVHTHPSLVVWAGRFVCRLAQAGAFFFKAYVRSQKASIFAEVLNPFVKLASVKVQPVKKEHGG